MDEERIREEVFAALGHAASLVMEQAPDAVMPTDGLSQIGHDLMMEVSRYKRAASDRDETAWGIIANALDWDAEGRDEWRAAAGRWRDEYHDSLPPTPDDAERPTPGPAR